MKKNIKIIKWICLILSIAVLTGCSSGRSLYTDEEKDALMKDGLSESEWNELDELNEDIKETESDTGYPDVQLLQSGVLQVNTVDNIPGMEYLEEDRTLTGFDVELASRIAEEIGADIQLHILGSEAACYREKNSDCIIAAVKSETSLPEGYLLTDPYTVYSNVILVSDGKKEDELTAFKGKTAAIVEKNPWKDTLAEICKLKEYGSMDECCDALKEGSVDIIAADTLSAAHASGCYDQFQTGWQENEKHDVCIAVNADNQSMLDTLNQIIEKLKKDGILDEMEKNYF